jgi:hypothetical protein
VTIPSHGWIKKIAKRLFNQILCTEIPAACRRELCFMRRRLRLERLHELAE